MLLITLIALIVLLAASVLSPMKRKVTTKVSRPRNQKNCGIQSRTCIGEIERASRSHEPKKTSQAYQVRTMMKPPSASMLTTSSTARTVGPRCRYSASTRTCTRCSNVNDRAHTVLTPKV